MTERVIVPEPEEPYRLELESTGIVIVDHGSRRTESNQRHEAFVEEWRALGVYRIVEPAHMKWLSHRSVQPSMLASLWGPPRSWSPRIFSGRAIAGIATFQRSQQVHRQLTLVFATQLRPRSARTRCSWK